MTVVCLHHNDLDGICSAGIVLRVFPEAECFLMDYGSNLPEIVGELTRDDRLIIVDFSLAPEKMLELNQQTQLTWIDHHVTAKNAFQAVAGGVEIDGIVDIGKAACVLTWEWFFPHEAIPHGIVLVGDRDIWTFQHGDATRYFNEYVAAWPNQTPESPMIQRIVRDKIDYKMLLDNGKLLYDSRLNSYRKFLDRFGFEVNFSGYKALAINHSGTGDLGEIIYKELGYDLAVCFMQKKNPDGRFIYTVSLYSDKVDVGELAKQRGGGGHKGASGFSIELPNSVIDFQSWFLV